MGGGEGRRKMKRREKRERGRREKRRVLLRVGMVGFCREISFFTLTSSSGLISRGHC